MRLLITDLNTKINKDLEKDVVGPKIKLDIFDDFEKVSPVAWQGADGIITYRGSKKIMQSMQNLKLYIQKNLKSDYLIAGYGAPTKASLLLTMANLGINEISFIIEGSYDMV